MKDSETKQSVFVEEVVPRTEADEYLAPSVAPRYPRFREMLPGTEIVQKDYLVRFAQSPAELDAVLKLRFKVFNIELGEGLDDSYLTRRDLDRFDAVCHHAIVLNRNDNKVVGTIRVHTHSMASRHNGFYSAEEFDLTSLPAEVLEHSIEMGRACILKSHRNKQVLFLLWKALAHYLSFNRQRFLFGCCSLNTQSPSDGYMALSYFRDKAQIHPKISVAPQPDFECGDGDPSSTESLVEIPTLFRTYMRYGAKVCSPPALDRAFKTIDFFVLFDVNDLDPRRYRIFFD